MATYIDAGLCLRNAQDDIGITSAHVAKTLGVKPQQVARWRVNPNMKLHTLLALAELFGLTVTEFLDYGG